MPIRTASLESKLLLQPDDILLGSEIVGRGFEFCFLQIWRTTATIGEFVVHFDLLRRKAEPRTHMEGSFPDTFVSILCMRNDFLSRSDKWLALADVQGDLGLAAVERQMERLFGPPDGAVRRDVLAAAKSDVNPSDDDYAALVAYRNAKKQMVQKGRGGGDQEKSGKSERGRRNS